MSDKSMEQAIIESAKHLFLERGYVATSTTDIAKEVGCNQSLINYYFRSKEKLFQTIFEEKALLFLSSLEKPLESNISFLEKIRIISERHFETLAKYPKLPFFILNEISTNPESLEIFRNTASKTFEKVIPSLERELLTEIQESRIKETTLFDIFLTMASLNIGILLLHPVLERFTPSFNIKSNTMLLERGKENAKILLLSLIP